MTVNITLMWLTVLVIFPATAFAQDQTNPCVLSHANDAQTVSLHGKIEQGPHDLALNIEGCSDGVVLTFAGNSDNAIPSDQLRRDQNLKRFRTYTSAVYLGNKKNLCEECMQYGDVEATLSGKLEIATLPPGTTKDSIGFLHDASGKIVGTYGWGHPRGIFKYRLVILSVANVKARKLPKPKPANP